MNVAPEDDRIQCPDSTNWAGDLYWVAMALIALMRKISAPWTTATTAKSTLSRISSPSSLTLRINESIGFSIILSLAISIQWQTRVHPHLSMGTSSNFIMKSGRATQKRCRRRPLKHKRNRYTGLMGEKANVLWPSNIRPRQMDTRVVRSGR